MKYAILFLVLILSACDFHAVAQKNVSENLSYFKDSKGICYAMIFGDYKSLTWVPCDNAGL